MTRFVKSEFSKHMGPYCYYQGKFVARFKHGGRADFINFLIKNFTVEEYFDLLAQPTATPQGVLESKGYINHNVKKALKAAGLAVTRENIPVLVANMYKPKVTPSLIGTEVENMAYFK